MATLLKMLIHAPRTFINRMFMVVVIVKAALVPVQVNFLMATMNNHLDATIVLHSKIISDCVGASLTMKTINIVDFVFNMGMLFCRFIYCRYAWFLTIEKFNHVPFLVSVVTVTFTFWAILAVPIMKLISNGDAEFLKSHEGVICTKDAYEFHRKEMDHEDDLQLFLIVFTFVCLVGSSASYFKYSAKKVSRKYAIPKIKINYTTFNNQYYCFMCTLSSLLFKKILLQNLSFWEDHFLVWWVCQLVFRFYLPMFIELFILVKIFELYDYNGLCANKYPGQQNPRIQTIQPRRNANREPIKRPQEKLNLHDEVVTLPRTELQQLTHTNEKVESTTMYLDFKISGNRKQSPNLLTAERENVDEENLKREEQLLRAQSKIKKEEGDAQSELKILSASKLQQLMSTSEIGPSKTLYRRFSGKRKKNIADLLTAEKGNVDVESQKRKGKMFISQPRIITKCKSSVHHRHEDSIAQDKIRTSPTMELQHFNYENERGTVKNMYLGFSRNVKETTDIPRTCRENVEAKKLKREEQFPMKTILSGTDNVSSRRILRQEIAGKMYVMSTMPDVEI